MGLSEERILQTIFEVVDEVNKMLPEEERLEKLSGTFLRTPKLEDVPYPAQMEPNLVIEFYSR